ncbi:MAG: hypothetical protein PHF84_10395, partial [bacterium]|nr:hypothetical protein [bacterium]
VSNNIGYSNFNTLVTYSLGNGNTAANFMPASTGTGCLTNFHYFVSTIFSSPDFVRLSGIGPSPAINTGDPSDPVPSGGGSRIDMGCFEYQIQPAQISISKYVNNVRLGGASSMAIPGSTIEYRMHYSNWSGVAENSIVYDRLDTPHVTYATNSFSNSQGGWTTEFSTNTSPVQTYTSSDYGTNQPAAVWVKWIRWKRLTIGINNSGDLYFRVIIR